jgi:excisionase family DNA binding protein
MAGPRAIDDYPEIMTSDDVAKLLGHPVKTIQVWAREGVLPAHREPGAHLWWFDRDELLAWLRSDATRVMPDAE